MGDVCFRILGYITNQDVCGFSAVFIMMWLNGFCFETAQIQFCLYVLLTKQN